MSKRTGWDNRDRTSKLSAILYPFYNDPDRAEIEQIAKGERKRAPTAQPLLKDHERGAVSPLGNVAQPAPARPLAEWAKKLEEVKLANALRRRKRR